MYGTIKFFVSGGLSEIMAFSLFRKYVAVKLFTAKHGFEDGQENESQKGKKRNFFLRRLIFFIQDACVKRCVRICNLSVTFFSNFRAKYFRYFALIPKSYRP